MITTAVGMMNPMSLLIGSEGKWKKTMIAHALTMVELEQSEPEIKHIDLRLKCNDIRATAYYVLLDALLLLSNTILFGGMLP